jgi:hypothetical protein
MIMMNSLNSRKNQISTQRQKFQNQFLFIIFQNYKISKEFPFLILQFNMINKVILLNFKIIINKLFIFIKILDSKINSLLFINK